MARSWRLYAMSALGLSAGLWISLSTLSRRPFALSPEIEREASVNVDQINLALSRYESRRISDTEAPWLLFHGLIGHRGDFNLQMKVFASEASSCQNWLLHELSWRPIFHDTPIVTRLERGVFFTRGPNPAIQQEFEDHFCQFAFYLMEAGADPDKTFVCVPPDGQHYSLQQMVHDEQRFCNGTLDVSWAMPVFARWGEDSWRNKFDEEFNLARVMRQHLDLQQKCAACLGAHWRMGLAYTLKYAGDRLPSDLREEAKKRLQAMIDQAKASQDSVTGQFSVRAAAKSIGITDLTVVPDDLSSRLSHQGHTIEWLMYALSDEELATQTWPHLAVRCLLNGLENVDSSFNYGAYSHCADALRLYRARMSKLSETKMKTAAQ